MIRANEHDNSSTLPLFPFVAVLLCTMGSLLILLVAMARSSRDQGLRQAADRKTAVAAPATDDPHRQLLEQIQGYVGKLKSTQADAEAQLRDDQQRLSHLEDHMWRLQEQLQSLQAAAAELNSMEQAHYDDREQAEREVARLQQLIAESKETIEKLKDEIKSKRKSYSVVPYEGKNGTHRRPIYIECRKESVVLQPEGIELTPDDFAPPIGPGNPLASALRAAREYIVREEPNAATGKEAEPYPLILVRPDGILAYYRVRDAIESWDADFGYELVDGDWTLQFPAADPRLQSVENHAVSLSRARTQALASAAPRAYGGRRGGGSSFNDDLDEAGADEDGFGGGSGGGGSGNGGGGSTDGVGTFVTNERGGADGASESVALARGPGNGGNSSAGVGGVAGGNGGGSGNSSGTAGGGKGGGEASEPNGSDASKTAGGAPAGSGGTVVAGQQGNNTHAVDRQNGAAPGAAVGEGAPGGQKDVNATFGGPGNELADPREGMVAVAPEEYERKPTAVGPNALTPHPKMRHSDAMPPRVADDDEPNDRDKKKSHSKNWGILNPQPDAVPIRRTIRVAVQADRLVIMSEPGAGADAAAAGSEFPMTGPRDVAMDRFVTALEAHVKSWGMAGQGLYWRPVLELNVGPDGQQRAAELVRQLKNSGIEVRGASIAENNKGDDARASR